MSHMVTERCMPGAKYDLRAVRCHMEVVLRKWLLAGWKIEMILFDGLTPLSKFKETERRRDIRVKEGIEAKSFCLPAGCADVCSDTILTEFPDISCRIAPGECDDILATLVYNYATQNPGKPTYVMTNDTDFCAFDFPDNVVILNTSVFGIDAGVINTLNPAKVLKERFDLCPSLAGYGAMEFTKLNKCGRLKDDVGYKKFAESQMAILQRFSFGSAQDYIQDEHASRVYRLLSNTNENNAHRVANAWFDYGQLYTFLQILCEPEEAEYAFDAGRKWRSVAYDLILEKIGAEPTEDQFQEHGRKGNVTHCANLPITDKARAVFDASSDTYKLQTREQILDEIADWNINSMASAIWEEALLTTPQSNGEYNEKAMYELSMNFLTQILRLEGGPRKLCSPFGPAYLRFYNKYFAIFQSMRLLEAAGVQLPVTINSYDLDGSLWYILARQAER
ncbi:YALIH222S01e36290g1_1 [Yarrowia lipolytica]|nr:YALIH222S01e36290g1_1 [Yarrowia lipolytica]